MPLETQWSCNRLLRHPAMKIHVWQAPIEPNLCELLYRNIVVLLSLAYWPLDSWLSSRKTFLKFFGAEMSGSPVWSWRHCPCPGLHVLLRLSTSASSREAVFPATAHESARWKFSSSSLLAASLFLNGARQAMPISTRLFSSRCPANISPWSTRLTSSRVWLSPAVSWVLWSPWINFGKVPAVSLPINLVISLHSRSFVELLWIVHNRNRPCSCF